MTVIALCVNKEGQLCLAADRMVGAMERRIDVRSKVFMTNSGYLVGVSGCAYNIDVEELCNAIDAGEVLKFMNSLDDRKVEFGIIVVTGSNAVAYHSEQDGKFSAAYLTSAGACAYTGDLGWIVHSLYKDGSLPYLEDVTRRIQHAHRAAGFVEDAQVVVSNLERITEKDGKFSSISAFPSVGDPQEPQSGHDGFLAYMTNVRACPESKVNPRIKDSKPRLLRTISLAEKLKVYNSDPSFEKLLDVLDPVFKRKLPKHHKVKNSKHLDLLSELLDIMMDSANRLQSEEGSNHGRLD